MSTVMQTLRLRLPGGPPFVPRPYQVEAQEAIVAGFDQGVRRQLAVLPTGAGKTEIFIQLILQLGVRALILAHRDELINQAADKAWRRVPEGFSIGVVQANRNEVRAACLVASIQTLDRPRRLAQLPRDIGLVIVDEAHHSAAPSYRRVLTGLGCFAADGPLLVGFTATPDRADGRTIGNTIFEQQTVTISVLDLIEAGYLCDIRGRSIHLAADLSGVHTHHGDFRAGELGSVLSGAGAAARVVQAYQEYGEDRKTIVFTPTVALAYEIASAFCAAGIAAEAADGTSKAEVRRGVVERFASGETQVAVNCGLWLEGFDEPSTSCIILCRPTKSRGLMTQMIGRGTRLSPGKTDCLVLDLVGQVGTHDVVSIPDVFGVPAAALAEGTVRTAARAAREAAAKQAEEEAAAQQQALLVSQEIAIVRRQGYHWLAVERAEGTPLFVLNYCDSGLLKLGETAPGVWAVVVNVKDVQPWVLGRGLERGTAQRMAEEFARTHGEFWAYRSDARWRVQPVSDKTRVFARSLGLTLPKDCTAGEATDRITAKKALAIGTGRSQTTPPCTER